MILNLILLLYFCQTFTSAEDYEERKPEYFLTFVDPLHTAELFPIFVTTAIPGSAVWFTVEIPGLDWELTAQAYHGEFAGINIPSLIGLNAGQRGIVIRSHSCMELQIAAGSFGLSDFSTDVFHVFSTEAFKTCKHNRCTYYVATYGWPLNSEGYLSFTAIVGQTDNTIVTITPSVKSVLNSSSGSESLGATRARTVMINKTETIFLTSMQDLTGSIIESNNPLSIFTGQECVKIPNDVGKCSFISEQLPPTEQWGSQFVAIATPTQPLYSIIRVTAYRDSTQVAFNCTNQTESFLTLQKGQFKDVTISTGLSCSVSSNMDILLMQFSIGSEDGRGDPHMYLIPPTKWYFSRAVAISPYHFADGWPYDNTIAITIPSEFYQLSDISYEGLSLDTLETYNHQVVYSGEATFHTFLIMNITTGSHYLHHSNPHAKFGITAFGTTQFDSYGYTVTSPSSGKYYIYVRMYINKRSIFIYIYYLFIYLFIYLDYLSIL